MSKKIYILILFLCVGLYSCKQSEKTEGKNHITSFFDFSNNELNIEKYLNWYNNNATIFKDSNSINDIIYTLSYVPAELDAYIGASQGNDLNKSNYTSLLNAKSGSHFFYLKIWKEKLSILNQKDSINNILKDIRQNIFIVKNENDTINNVITEYYPAQVLNHPSELLVFVPKDSITKSIKIIIPSKNLTLDLSQEILKKLPKLKI